MSSKKYLRHPNYVWLSFSDKFWKKKFFDFFSKILAHFFSNFCPKWWSCPTSEVHKIFSKNWKTFIETFLDAPNTPLSSAHRLKSIRQKEMPRHIVFGKYLQNGDPEAGSRFFFSNCKEKVFQKRCVRNPGFYFRDGKTGTQKKK